MTQALFEFLAVYALLRWKDDPANKWLGLSAALAKGLALGTKMMAMFMLPALCIWLAILARKRRSRQALMLAGLYGLGAVLVASPWYVADLVLVGDPVFPFLRGGEAWPPARPRPASRVPTKLWHGLWTAGFRGTSVESVRRAPCLCCLDDQH